MFSDFPAGDGQIDNIFLSVQVYFRNISIQMEDPFVLRQALDVTRRQLWDLQNRMTGNLRSMFYSSGLSEVKPGGYKEMSSIFADQ